MDNTIKKSVSMKIFRIYLWRNTVQYSSKKESTVVIPKIFRPNCPKNEIFENTIKRGKINK